MVKTLPRVGASLGQQIAANFANSLSLPFAKLPYGTMLAGVEFGLS
jgi:hypothetical protein